MVPLVSVILPVYNAEKFIVSAIESVLAQDFKNFELLVINDGSTDESEQLIKKIVDPRIVYIKNATNIGLIATLNKGIDAALGKYIARMDADDISMSTRFELQVAFLENNLEIGLCGTSFFSWDGLNKDLKTLPSNAEEIKSELLFRNVIAHPTVMMRKKVLIENALRYSMDALNAEDYDLWTRMARVTSIANLPLPLLLYRVHAMQVTQTQKEQKEATRHKIMWNYFSWFGLLPSGAEKEIHIHISDGKSKGSLAFLEAAEAWLKKIEKTVSESGKINTNAIEKVIGNYWLKVCENSGLGWEAKRKFSSSELSQSLSLRSRLKMIYKILIRYKQY